MPVGVRVTREGSGLSLPESLAGTVGVDDGTDGTDWTDGSGAPGSIPGSSTSTVTDSTVAVDPATTIRVPDGGVDDLGGGEARLRFVLSRGGGGNLLATVASSGSAESLDLSAANVFDVTLDDDCTLSFANPPAAGIEGRWTIILRGEFTVTWPASVYWRDTDGSATTTAPTLSGEQNVVVLTTLDGGTSYGASLENGSNGSTGGATALDDLTDVTITAPTTGDVLTYDGAAWVNDAPASGGGQYRAWLFTASGGTLTILTAVDGTPLTGLMDLE